MKKILFLSLFVALCGFNTFAQNSIAITYLNIDDYVTPGDYPISLSVNNDGNNIISSFQVNWSVNGGATATYKFTNISVPTNNTIATFEVPNENISIEGGDNFDINVWIDEINGSSISSTADNQSNKMVRRVTSVPDKKVLFEKTTATWCGNCPLASLVVDDMLVDFEDNFLLASLHKSDAFECPQFDVINAVYGLPQPSGMIDRTVFPAASLTFQGFVDSDPDYPSSSWSSFVSQKIGTVTPVQISTSTTYNNSTRQLDVTVNATFYADMDGEYRFNAYIMEDHIFANQSNYYSAAGPTGTISNYDHRYTVRDMLGGDWGDGAIMNPIKGNTYSQTYTYTLPNAYDETNVEVYAIVQQYGTTTFERSYINALEVGLNDTNAHGITEIIDNSCSAPMAPVVSTDVNTLCQGETATLTAEQAAPAGYAYRWEVNGALLSNETSQSLTTSTPGTYIAYLSNGDTASPCNSDFSQTIFIGQGLQPNFNTSPTVNGFTVTFNTALQGGQTTQMDWSWGNGDSTYTTQNPSYTYSEPGTYFVCPTAYNDCGQLGQCIPVTIAYPFELNTRVLLEGSYSSGGLMNNNLSPLIPLENPYAEAPYFHTGGETLGFLPANVVDWVLVEARSGTPSSGSTPGTNLVESRAGLLMTDGSIVDLDGVTPLGFRSLVTGTSYYFTVRHRNHLDVISSSAVFATAQITYYFTSSSTQAAGTAQQKSSGDGFFMLYAGDYNQDGIIQTTDYDLWQSQPAVVNTYSSTDGTMDGIIQATDYDAWFPNKAKIGNVEIQY